MLKTSVAYQIAGIRHQKLRYDCGAQFTNKNNRIQEALRDCRRQNKKTGGVTQKSVDGVHQDAGIVSEIPNEDI